MWKTLRKKRRKMNSFTFLVIKRCYTALLVLWQLFRSSAVFWHPFKTCLWRASLKSELKNTLEYAIKRKTNSVAWSVEKDSNVVRSHLKVKCCQRRVENWEIFERTVEPVCLYRNCSNGANQTPKHLDLSLTFACWSWFILPAVFGAFELCIAEATSHEVICEIGIV